MFKEGDIVTFKPLEALPESLNKRYAHECAARHGKAYVLRAVGHSWGGGSTARKVVLDSLDGTEKALVALASYGLGDDSIQLFKAKYPTNRGEYGKVQSR